MKPKDLRVNAHTYYYHPPFEEGMGMGMSCPLASYAGLTFSHGNAPLTKASAFAYIVVCDCVDKLAAANPSNSPLAKQKVADGIYRQLDTYYPVLDIVPNKCRIYFTEGWWGSDQFQFDVMDSCIRQLSSNKNKLEEKLKYR